MLSWLAFDLSAFSALPLECAALSLCFSSLIKGDVVFLTGCGVFCGVFRQKSKSPQILVVICVVHGGDPREEARRACREEEEEEGRNGMCLALVLLLVLTPTIVRRK